MFCGFIDSLVELWTNRSNVSELVHTIYSEISYKDNKYSALSSFQYSWVQFSSIQLSYETEIKFSPNCSNNSSIIYYVLIFIISAFDIKDNFRFPFSISFRKFHTSQLSFVGLSKNEWMNLAAGLTVRNANHIFKRTTKSFIVVC